MSTCQTCYSLLAPSTSRTAFHTPCCNTPICDPCLARNPRLRTYDPCLRCGDVRTASGEDRIKAGKARVIAERRDAEEGQFTIGDSDDEVDDEEDRPPSYTSFDPKDSENSRQSGSCSGSRRGSINHSTPKSDGKDEEEDEMEIVEVKHPVSGGDTLYSIARRYAADPYDLLTLNSLPPSALTSNPRIIQTRKTLIISRRRLPRGSIPNTLFDAGEALDPDEAARRDEERRLKRFQIITKTTDVGVGKVYLGLAGLDEGRHVLELGSGECLPASSARAEVGAGAGAGAGEGGIGGGAKKKRDASREDRALDAFWEDSAWETEVGGPERVKINGRWTVVGSSSPFAGLSIKS